MKVNSCNRVEILRRMRFYSRERDRRERETSKSHSPYSPVYHERTFRKHHSTIERHSSQRHCTYDPAPGPATTGPTIAGDSLRCRADRRTDKYHRIFSVLSDATVAAAAGSVDRSPFDFETNAQIHQDLFR